MSQLDKDYLMEKLGHIIKFYDQCKTGEMLPKNLWLSDTEVIDILILLQVWTVIMYI